MGKRLEDADTGDCRRIVQSVKTICETSALAVYVFLIDVPSTVQTHLFACGHEHLNM